MKKRSSGGFLSNSGFLSNTLRRISTSGTGYIIQDVQYLHTLRQILLLMTLSIVLNQCLFKNNIWTWKVWKQRIRKDLIKLGKLRLINNEWEFNNVTVNLINNHAILFLFVLWHPKLWISIIFQWSVL